LKREFLIKDDWLPFEIHPDTPQNGVLLKDYFPGMNPESFFQQLDERGRKMGVRFGSQQLLSNSREALEAGEFAKQHDRHSAYHEGVFRAFFTQCKDIGRREILLEVAGNAGLDAGELASILDAKRYLPRLEETARAARSLGIRSVPTFVIEGYGAVAGAQPFDSFRVIFDSLRHQRIKQ
jgi:predicted DsbA family dithiol-disulfide isomerase